MANTFAAIATATAGSGGLASIQFTSIPNTYTDLCIKLSARTTNAYFRDSVEIRFNSVNANLACTFIIGQTSTVSAGPASVVTVEVEGNTNNANLFSIGDIYIPSYRSSNYKNVSVTYGSPNTTSGSNAIGMTSGIWSDTSAITSIILTSASFMQYSTATLYGIKNT